VILTVALPELTNSNLRDALFSPRSVAIVGQSDDASKAAGRPLKFLRCVGYAGRVYPINPRRQTVLGERAWPALAALPETPDHAYIVTSTEAAVAAVEECGALGVKVATVLADGFAEAGAEGIARETRLRETCARTGIRIVGPSSLGVVDLRTRIMLTANAAFDEKDFPLGRVFAASHSGSMIGALMSRGKARGTGFAGFVSVGNEVDLSLGEICAATLDDPDIDGYMLFLETMRHADTLRRFAHSAAERGKPIIAYKLGRSATARELAVSHTGALAGEDDVADQFLKSCGIARVDTLEGLLEGLPLLSRVPVAARGGRKRVGVVTTTAGGATMVVDPLASRGVTIEPASADTLARLAAAGVEVKPARLVDLTIAGARYQTMKAALDILTTAPEFDLVLAAIGSSARSQPETTVRPIIDSAGAARPLAAFLVPDAPQALACSAARACRISARRRHAPTPLPQRYRGNRRGHCLRVPRRRPQAAGRFSTSSQPVRCSTVSALHARHRLRSRWTSPARRPCPSLIRSRSRCCAPRSRTRPTSAASRSVSPTATRCLRRSEKSPRPSPNEALARASPACWCSPWCLVSARSCWAIASIATWER
jgi:acetate---CoA ligase (ADP-forming)